MPAYRSRTSTHGRNMAGARGLWRATGMKNEDFGKPIIAVVNSFTQFVPGHVHLKDLGQLVAREIEKAGGIAKEFNTIAIDDGIAMGHDGMLYSLPSRELIADSVEYMVNAPLRRRHGLHFQLRQDHARHADGVAAAQHPVGVRLRRADGGRQGGALDGRSEKRRSDRRHGRRPPTTSMSDADVAVIEAHACPTCGSCSGMFTANSMNCLTEALGLSLPGNGSVLATHADRKRLFVEAGHLIVDITRRYYEQNDDSVLPRNVASFAAFENAMTLDIAMGGSTNTVLHLLAAAQEGEVNFTMDDIDRLSRQVPCLCKVAPVGRDVHMEDVHRAGGIMSILGELDAAGLINGDSQTVHATTLARGDRPLGHQPHQFRQRARSSICAAPGGVPTQIAFSQSRRWDSLDTDREKGVIRSKAACLLAGRRPRGAVRQHRAATAASSKPPASTTAS